jgi:hypothetical protein
LGTVAGAFTTRLAAMTWTAAMKSHLPPMLQTPMLQTGMQAIRIPMTPPRPPNLVRRRSTPPRAASSPRRAGP